MKLKQTNEMINIRFSPLICARSRAITKGEAPIKISEFICDYVVGTIIRTSPAAACESGLREGDEKTDNGQGSHINDCLD